MDWPGYLVAIATLASIARATNPCLEDLGSSKFVREPKIVGGYAVPDSFPSPWLVSLRDESMFHFCGGTVIAPNIVLTAAHCVSPRPDLPWWDNRFPLVAVGNHDQAADYQHEEDFFQPYLTIVHGGFNRENVTNDVALLFFNEDLVDKNGVSGYVTLPDAGHDIVDGEKGITFGWGLIEEDASLPSSQLYGVETIMYSISTCRNISSYEPGSLLDGAFCAGSDPTTNNTGVDACSGDSGGPLLDYGASSDEDSPLQVGIVSWGLGCGRKGYPGVYVDLSKYVTWIAEEMEFVESLKPSLSCFSPWMASNGTMEVDNAGDEEGVEDISNVAINSTIITAGMGVDVGTSQESVSTSQRSRVVGHTRSTDNNGNMVYISDACSALRGTL